MTVWIAANAIAIAVVLGLLLRHAWPPSALVRIRNAFLGRPASASECAWTPAEVPGSFRIEHRPAPALFADAVHTFGLVDRTSDWGSALRIATHLVENARHEGPIQSSLEQTYRRIREGYGYCADYTKVYLALAHAAGLFARQWAFSFDGFGGHGHVMVEAFDRQSGRWRWIDVYNNFHAVDAQTREPLSAEQMWQAALGNRPMPELVVNGRGRPGYQIISKAIDYYQRGAREWYLWMGNDVLSYDAHPLVRLGNRVAGGIGQAIAAMLGVHPKLLILKTPQNEANVSALLKLRRSVAMLTVVLVVLVVALAAQIAWLA